MSSSTPAERLLPKPGPEMVVDTFKLVVTSASEWITVLAEEKRRREEISVWASSQIEIIRVQQNFLLAALEKTFDERRENFRRLFDQLDGALLSGSDNAAAQAADLLEAITDLAKTSPFKDLKSPALVVQEFLQGGRVIEI